MTELESVGRPVTVEVAGRVFTATRVGPGHWWLMGQRGALMRTHKRSDGKLFLVGYGRGGGKFRPDPLGRVLLTDEDGSLHEVSI